MTSAFYMNANGVIANRTGELLGGRLGKLRLPALQPGSSIMPGKVNPGLCEMVVALAGASGS